MVKTPSSQCTDGAWVQSLAGELGSHTSHGMTNKEKKKQQRETCLTY